MKAVVLAWLVAAILLTSGCSSIMQQGSGGRYSSEPDLESPQAESAAPAETQPGGPIGETPSSEPEKATDYTAEPGEQAEPSPGATAPEAEDAEKTIEIIEEKSEGEKVYLIADTHFGRGTVISRGNRPFSGVEEMDAAMLENWNNAVKDEDTVYFLGDFTDHDCNKAMHWLNRLKGRIVFIQGNHDELGSPTCKGDWENGRIIAYASTEKIVLRYNGREFLLIHNPNSSEDWNGWKIHGHTHIDDPEYSLINSEKKTMNVGADLVNYTPVEIDVLLGNLDAIEYWWTLQDEPVLKNAD